MQSEEVAGVRHFVAELKRETEGKAQQTCFLAKYKDEKYLTLIFNHHILRARTYGHFYGAKEVL